MRRVEEPLRLATEALHEKFLAILHAEGFNIADLSSAQLYMQFPSSDDYYCQTGCRLTTTDGKQFDGYPFPFHEKCEKSGLPLPQLDAVLDEIEPEKGYLGRVRWVCHKANNSGKRFLWWLLM